MFGVSKKPSDFYENLISTILIKRIKDESSPGGCYCFSEYVGVAERLYCSIMDFDITYFGQRSAPTLANCGNECMLLMNDEVVVHLFRSGLVSQNRFQDIWDLSANLKRREKIVGGKSVEVKRKEASYGADTSISMSQIPNIILPFLTEAQNRFDSRLNGVLIEWFESGADLTRGSIQKGTVYMLNLSQDSSRVLRLKPKIPRKSKNSTISESERKVLSSEKTDIVASNGLIVCMDGSMTNKLEYRIPKNSKAERHILITFRTFDAKEETEEDEEEVTINVVNDYANEDELGYGSENEDDPDFRINIEDGSSDEDDDIRNVPFASFGSQVSSLPQGAFQFKEPTTQNLADGQGPVLVFGDDDGIREVQENNEEGDEEPLSEGD